LTNEATFTPCAQDFVDVTRARFVRAVLGRRFAVRLAVLILITPIAVIGIFMPLGMAGPDAAYGAVLGSLGGVIALFVIILGMYILIPRRARRTFQQQKTAHAEMTVRWSTDALTLVTPFGETRYPWANLHGWAESTDTVLVLASDTVSYFIPKRALSNSSLVHVRATLSASGLPRR